jgi:hypothetical protein
MIGDVDEVCESENIFYSTILKYIRLYFTAKELTEPAGEISIEYLLIS